MGRKPFPSQPNATAEAGYLPGGTLSIQPPAQQKVGSWTPSPTGILSATPDVMMNPAGIEENPDYLEGMNGGSSMVSQLSGQAMKTSDFTHNNMQPFFDSLKSRNVVIVGPSYLKMNMFEYTHIVTPEVGAWDYLEKIRIEIRKAISASKDPVILYSCSLAAKLLIRDFHKQLGDSITQIDTGSVFDPYAGVDSRSYHSDVIKRLNIETKKKVHIK
jgi:hypothetical protein